MFEHFERLAIRHLGHAIGDSGDPVMQGHLSRPNIHRVVMLLMEARARGRKEDGAQEEQREGRGDQAPLRRDESDRFMRKHSQCQSP